MGHPRLSFGTIVHVLLCLTLAAVSAVCGGPVAAQVVPDTGTVPAGKFTLRYRIEGTGIPAIVVGDPVAHPRTFSQNLRRHLRLVFIDHRGSAPSPGKVDTTEFHLENLVDDIERARKQLNLGPYRDNRTLG